MDKDYWRYQTIVLQKTKETLVHHINGWQGFTELVFSSVFTLVAVFFKPLTLGGYPVSDTGNIVIGAIGGPILFTSALAITEYVFAHFRIFTEKENEADKLNWNRIEFDIITYKQPNMYEFSIRVTNKKPYTISNFKALVKSIETDNTITQYNSALPLVIDREFKYTDYELSKANPAYIGIIKTDSYNRGDGSIGKRVDIPKEPTGHLYYMDDDYQKPEIILELGFGGRIDIYDLPLIKKMYRIYFLNNILKVEPYNINVELK